jgi:hypothetical protein
MKRRSHIRFSLTCFLMLFLLSLCANVLTLADEGMWTFDNPPSKQLKEKYGFTPTQEWLDHVRLASVRFMDGGSGSFVSPNGLVLTNHHVAMGQLQKISTAETNYVATGFYAASTEEEIKCPDLEVNILVSVEDVTKEVMSALKENMTDAETLKARDAVIAKIEKESLDKTGLRSNVVSLYRGGEYWLYRYKKYTDVRLVMAPERQAAFFGGDSDNFTYPRYDLDFAFFRIYENEKPVHSEHFLKWNAKGAGENELVFVSGNPGSTDRLYTYRRLEFQRDIFYPIILKYIDRRLEMLTEYSGRGEEQARRALGQIFGFQNGKKALSAELDQLLDENLMSKRKKEEEDFRKLVASKPQWKEKYDDAWDVIAETVDKNQDIFKKLFFQQLQGSRMAGYATTIVRYVVEVKKDDADRLPGYHDSELEELRFRLFSPAPIYKDFEEALLIGNFKLSMEELGADDGFIKTVLKDHSPEEVLKGLVSGTKLDDPEFRKSLIEGGEKAVKKSKDPMIALAREVDPMMRELEKWTRDNVESVLTSASEKIAQARFAVYGKTTYPDATFTLRLSYGTVKGYPMNATMAPYKTTLYGLYDRSISFDKKGEYALPQRFWDRKDKLDLSTPVNFVSTCDIIGGNSGSPVINKNGEFVGVIFDGNIESLAGRFVFDDTKNRAVSVHSAYIIEAMRKLYDAGKLADEVEGK